MKENDLLIDALNVSMKAYAKAEALDKLVTELHPEKRTELQKLNKVSLLSIVDFFKEKYQLNIDINTL
jgi:hypothetical protein